MDGAKIRPATRANTAIPKNTIAANVRRSRDGERISGMAATTPAEENDAPIQNTYGRFFSWNHRAIEVPSWDFEDCVTILFAQR